MNNEYIKTIIGRLGFVLLGVILGIALIHVRETLYITRQGINHEYDIIPQPLSNYNYNIEQKNVLGEYYPINSINPFTDQIILYQGRTPTTIIHEIGHRIWYKTLTEANRQAFSNQAILSCPENKSVSECFADSIECYYSTSIGRCDLPRKARIWIDENKAIWEY